MIEEIIKDLGISYLFFVKAAAIVMLFIYLAFSFVIVKQVSLMIDTLEVGFERSIRFIAYLHFFAVIITLIFAIMTL